MKKYFIIMFLLFSGFEPTSRLLGWFGVPPSVDYAVTLLFGILVPLFIFGRSNIQGSRLKLPIVLIILTVAIRFILDGLTQETITRGPWKVFLVVGLLYSSYFAVQKGIGSDNFHAVIKYFVGVASAISIINIIQIIFPDLPVLGGATSFANLGAEVGNTFIRFQTNYYHFSTLAIILLFYMLVQPKLNLGRRVWLIILTMLNFCTVLIAGYRANMYALILTVVSFSILLFGKLTSTTKTWIIVASIPMIALIYEYSVVRSEETTSAEGEETSLVYRFLEAGLAIEKLDQTGNWWFGIGYADGIINPAASGEAQETYYLHNGFLSIVYNYGIVGGVVWIIFIVTILVFILRNLRLLREDALFCIVSLHIVAQLLQNFSSGIFNREPAATFCFIFAFTVLEKEEALRRGEFDPLYMRSIPLVASADSVARI